MKLLHTSDWHLGHSLYNYDRTDEQHQMLRQIIDIVNVEKPDVFLLCGDVYHTAQPSASVQRLFVDVMAEMHEANPEMKIFVTAGNHDSASRHEVFARPWKALGVTTVGTVNNEHPEQLIFEVPNVCFIIAVPYCHERNMPDNLFKTLLTETEKRNINNLPVIMTAHTTVRGCDFRGHEQANDIAVGGIDGIAVDDFGEGYDYLALGHIHRPQTIWGTSGRARYSGTPLPVSFDEDYPHSVSVVEIEERGAKPEIREFEINNCRPLVSLPQSGVASFDDALALLNEFPDNIPAYIRLNVDPAGFISQTARSRAEQAVENKHCRFCLINLINPDTHQKRSADAGMSIEHFKELSPMDIARMYAEEKGFPFDTDLKDLLQGIITDIIEEERK